jgi:hypothetical protein
MLTIALTSSAFPALISCDMFEDMLDASLSDVCIFDISSLTAGSEIFDALSFTTESLAL